MPDATSWHAADKDYQAHHIGCPRCIAAGINRSSETRCPEGQALWEIYSSASMPAHLSRQPAPAHTAKFSSPPSKRAFNPGASQ